MLTPTHILQAILQAEQKIRPYIRKTPLEYSHHLSKSTNSQVYLKLENLQLTGSFKVRGAMNALLSLPGEQNARGVVTASSGNHGIAVAYGLNTLKINGTIFLPEDTPLPRSQLFAIMELILAFGALIVLKQRCMLALMLNKMTCFISPLTTICRS